MKWLFLDIDGVLNSEYFFRLRERGDVSHNVILPEIPEHYRGFLDNKAVQRVRRICLETGAEVVLSSSWRMDPRVIAYLSMLGIDVYGTTPSMRSVGGCRGDEIGEFLRQNPAEAYCILDDDSDMLGSQKKNFVHIDSFLGLTDIDADRAVDILSNKI